MSAEKTSTETIGNVLFKDLKIMIVAGPHKVSSEQEYISSRRRIGDLGVGFFMRGFRNILFMEDGLGTLNPMIDQVNKAAIQYRSFRTAYWRIVRHVKESDAKKLTQLFEQKPAERFMRVGIVDGITDDESGMQAFTYGEFEAMDHMMRKGYNLTLAAEKSSNARQQFLAINEKDQLLAWRECARLTHETDIELASQIEELAIRNRNRTRIMAIVGTAHLPLRKSLPSNLRAVCQTDRLNPTKPIPDEVILLHNIQKGGITDIQLTQRLDTIATARFGHLINHN